MDSLQSILGKKKFTPPTEVKSVKEYIKKRYNSACSVRLNKYSLILSVPNSALAATIHMDRIQLIQDCGIDKKLRLIIRTGS